MPVKAAGWRIEPPVSVPVAPGAIAAATAAAEPPDEPPGVSPMLLPLRRHGRDHRPVGAGLVGRAHCELVHVELAEHSRAGFAQVGGDGAFVGRLETLEDAAAGGAVHAARGEQVLDAERNARERRQIAIAARLVRGFGCRERVLRRLHRIGVERPRGGNGGVVRLRHLARAELARADPVAQLGDGERSELAHSSSPERGGGPSRSDGGGGGVQGSDPPPSRSACHLPVPGRMFSARLTRSPWARQRTHAAHPGRWRGLRRGCCRRSPRPRAAAASGR